nr:aminotransferase class I/II-fold pyridoxal phosphate-dependent enzyme [Candidatus Electrothrix aestuarii]
MAAAQETLNGLHRYPDGSSYHLTNAVAQWTGATPEEIILGSGSNEVIEFLVKAFVRSGDEVITSHPSFLMYQKFVQVGRHQRGDPAQGHGSRSGGHCRRRDRAHPAHFSGQPQ